MTYTPQSVASEFDLLMSRAKLEIDAGWREQMLVEFSHMRRELDIIHTLANEATAPVDVAKSIISGRDEI
ncbi:hypothetical protein [Agrobacterium sp. T29]|uniref:hypothetical protein n=1 Tax=Agrobacterium sp. T29 TaxID=2580515 RepID=UPI00115CC0E7|nr:hypothetical protein [Agrobacterium sp. T29]